MEASALRGELDVQVMEGFRLRRLLALAQRQVQQVHVGPVMVQFLFHDAGEAVGLAHPDAGAQRQARPVGVHVGGAILARGLDDHPVDVAVAVALCHIGVDHMLLGRGACDMMCRVWRVISAAVGCLAMVFSSGDFYRLT